MGKKKHQEPELILKIEDINRDSIKVLTAKQRKFAEFYVLEGNKNKAALMAGYSPTSSRWVGVELCKNKAIQAYIGYLLNIQDGEIMATVEEAKRRMSLAFRGQLKEDVVVTLQKSHEYYDKRGKKVTKKQQEAAIIEKKISIRDQIEATKLYVDLMTMDTNAYETDKRKSTEEELLKALKGREVDIPVVKAEDYEEEGDATDENKEQSSK